MTYRGVVTCGTLGGRPLTRFFMMCSQESEYVPWSFALRGLRSLALRLVTPSNPIIYERFVANLLTNVLDYVGFDEVNSGEHPEEHARAMLRITVHEAAVFFKATHIAAEVCGVLLLF